MTAPTEAEMAGSPTRAFMLSGVSIVLSSGDIAAIASGEAYDALLCPTNCQLLMGGGASLALKRAAGDEIETEATRSAPRGPGQAVVTCAGRLPLKAIIHVPTVRFTWEESAVEYVRVALWAGLRCAHHDGHRSVAMPGMGTGTGGVPYEAAAECFWDVLDLFLRRNAAALDRIAIVDHSGLFLEALAEEAARRRISSVTP